MNKKIKTGIPIWGDMIPGNNQKNKIAVMDIGRRKPDFILLLKAAFSMPGTTMKNGRKAKQALETYQYYHEIKTGFRPETYEDVPCIDYYPCEGAETAVLIISGGGFTYQSNSGAEPEKQYEAGMMAARLNEAGIAAFVLSRYRLTPYRMPIPLLDAQRAVRYIKYHAKEFSIHPDKLGIMGFSAGGLETSGTINILRNRSVNEILSDAGMDDITYVQDEIDKTDAGCAFAGLIYPMLGFRGDVPMMYTVFPIEEVEDETKRSVLLDKYDTVNYVRRGDIPQFIAMGTKDNAVDDADDKTRYMAALKKNQVPYEYLAVEGAKHGFGASNKKYIYWVDRYISWIKKVTEK